jgi:hypothetical protein
MYWRSGMNYMCCWAIYRSNRWQSCRKKYERGRKNWNWYNFGGTLVDLQLYFFSPIKPTIQPSDLEEELRYYCCSLLGMYIFSLYGIEN